MANSSKEVFALDIGTRTVAGLVVRKEDKIYDLIAYEVIEHESRVMYDGQIHDIEAVAKSVRLIKESLEKKVGYKLDKAAVAAAGRALYTVEAQAKKRTSPYIEITQEDIRALETDALANAIKELSNKDHKSNFENYYCVGFSPVKWLLNHEALDNLLGQKGQQIAVKIVATFLPRTVVEGLLTVLNRCDLKLDSLTLEPIAASDVVVQPGMRKLNIALVDIGAGTSDIALSRDGSIFAYGMVPKAGDEVTEKICEKFLLDFDVGERVKKELISNNKIEFQDILGVTHKLSKEEIMEAAQEAIDELSSAIALKITELNGKAPAAVLCIGGGSLMPGLSEQIAANLELTKERVGIKSRDGLNVQGCDEFFGPFSVTPIGIAVNALTGSNLSFIKVYVNGKPVNILGQEKPQLLDALMYSGLSSSEIFGRPGMALTFKLNDELKIARGEMASPAEVTIDGEKASFDTMIYDGAEIKFKPAKDGAPARARIGDYIEEEHKTMVKINGRNVEIEPIIELNGQKASPDEYIPDDAQVLLKSREIILSDIFNIISFKPEGIKGKLIMKINGIDAGFTSVVKDKDEVEIFWQNIPN